MTREQTIKINLNDKIVEVARRDYVTAKTKDLREFGYPNLTEAEVDEQISAILTQQKLSVIGMFMQDDIVISD
jgi:hypothetical protein